MLFDDRAVEMEESRAEDEASFLYTEKVLSAEAMPLADGKETCTSGDVEDLWWQLLELLQRRTELRTFLIVPDAIRERWQLEQST